MNAFTLKSAPAEGVNQQCLITVYPAGPAPAQAAQDPASYFAEGTYVIDLIGGGGGGGGGGAAAKKTSGGEGGDGASAVPMRAVKYLAPGDYKLTIGSGGAGGDAKGGRTEDGNPSSLTRADTGELVAGFGHADTHIQTTEAAGSGAGGVAAAGGASGASGAKGGGTSDSTVARAAQDGGDGGPGLIRLTMSKPTPMAAAPAPAPVMGFASKDVVAPARAARKDRN
ncbi:MAG: hypothetical protein IH604_13065 [Burkholderiales bacterium]|nr:hypothetical protein [Burkholderiales bacterium]